MKIFKLNITIEYLHINNTQRTRQKILFLINNLIHKVFFLSTTIIIIISCSIIIVKFHLYVPDLKLK